MAIKLTRLLRDILAVIGLASALVTLLLAVHGGYRWLGEQSTQNQLITSWQTVANELLALGIRSYEDIASLDIVVFAIEQVQTLTPDDQAVQRQLFLAQGTLAYLDLQTRPFAYDDWHKDLPALAAEGWKVLESTPQDEDRLPILLTLAGLESWLPSPRAAATTESLLRQAHQLAPTNPESGYRLADHLLERDKNSAEAAQLLEDVIETTAANPIYLNRLGALLLEGEDKNRGLALLERSAAAVTEQSNWLEQRAGSNAEAEIYAWLMTTLRASELPAFAEEKAHIHRLANSMLTGKYYTLWSGKAVLAKYWAQQGQFRPALVFLVESDTDFSWSNVRGVIDKERRYYQLSERQLPPRLEVAAKALAKLYLQQDSEWLEAMEKWLENIDERLYMEMEDEQGRMVKIGIEAQNWSTTDVGLLVLRSVPGYPYSRAGVRPGDRIVAIGGEPVQRLPMLANQIMSRAPGSMVSLSVIRDDQLLDFNLTVE